METFTPLRTRLSSICSAIVLTLIFLSFTFNSSAQADWLYGCDDGVQVDLYGEGANCSNNPDAKATIPNPSNVFQTVVEVVYKSYNAGETTIVTASNGNNYALNQVPISGGSSGVYVYRGTLPGNLSYVFTNSENNKCKSNDGLQSIIAYAFRNVPEAVASSGVFTNISGYCDNVNIQIPIAGDGTDRDVSVEVPFSEMTSDGRHLKVTASAGGESASITINGPSSGCCLNVVSLTIPNVPGTASQVNININTEPNTDNMSPQNCGQSWVIGGVVKADFVCEGCNLSVDLGEDELTCSGESVTLKAIPTGASTCGGDCSVNGQNLLVWDLENCSSNSGSGSNMDYSEFTAVNIANGGCDNISGSIIQRDQGDHSCTPGYNGATGMCIGTESSCNYDNIDMANDPYVLYFTVDIDPSDLGHLTQLSFREKAPTEYEWIGGSSGPNNWPTKYAMTVLKNGSLIYSDFDIPTTQSWSLETFDFSNLSAFEVTTPSTFRFELRAYCRVGNGASKSVWDLDDFFIKGGCCTFSNSNDEVTYNWSNGMTGSEIIVSPNSNTTYSVTATDCAGCTASDDIFVSVNNCSEQCYAIAQSSDGRLYNWDQGGNNTQIGTLGAQEVETMALNYNGTIIYAADADRLGTVDRVTGDFTPIGPTFGSANGADGNQNINDIDGLAMDPNTGMLFGTERRGSENDLLVMIDPVTGEIIEDFFGPGVDYVIISGTLMDIDDISFDPVTDLLYAVSAVSGSDTNNKIITINTSNGATNHVATLPNCDIEGLTFNDAGELFGSTGTSDCISDNSLFKINLANETTIYISTFGHSDVEAIACLITAPPPREPVELDFNDCGSDLAYTVQMKGVLGGPYCINVDNPSTVTQIFAEVWIDGSDCSGSAPNSITIQANGNSYTAYPVDIVLVTPGEKLYRVLIPGSANDVCVTNVGDGDVTSIALYVERMDGGASSTVYAADIELIGPSHGSDHCQEVSMPLGAATMSRDLIFSIPVHEKTDNTREVEITVEALNSSSNVIASNTQTFTAQNAGGEAALYNMTLTNVSELGVSARVTVCSPFINGASIGLGAVVVGATEGCCDNVTDGGEISADQQFCGDEYNPSPFASISPASGGSGDLEYIWLFCTSNCAPPSSSNDPDWTLISGANSETYNPGLLNQTTKFIRCARREGCEEYIGESNILVVTLNEGPSCSASVISNYNGEDVSCFGASDGSAKVYPTGGTPGFSYEWSNGQTNQTATGLSAGTYSVTVTDSNGCECITSVKLLDPDPLSCDITITSDYNGEDVSCNEASDGTASVSGSGGTGGFIFEWSNGQTGTTATGLGAGTYVVTVTDFNGCESTCDITLTEPDPILCSAEVTSNYNGEDISCTGAQDGSASVSASGGNPGYSYSWSNGQTGTSLPLQMPMVVFVLPL
jgi:hypothetical protein